MDRALLAACLSTATTIVANTGNLINMHHGFAKSVVIGAAFELYDEIQQKIAEREAIKGELPGVKERERV